MCHKELSRNNHAMRTLVFTLLLALVLSASSALAATYQKTNRTVFPIMNSVSEDAHNYSGPNLELDAYLTYAHRDARTVGDGAWRRGSFSR